MVFLRHLDIISMKRILITMKDPIKNLVCFVVTAVRFWVIVITVIFIVIGLLCICSKFIGYYI